MRFDAILIGAGQANPPLARTLVARGQTVALIEANVLGGSCVNYGCTPSKTLIGSAHALHLARQGAEFGFHAEVTVDFARVMQRQRDAVLKSRGGMEKRYGELNGLTLIYAHAEFEAPRRVRAGDEVYEAERVYLDVGARPAPPPISGLDRVPYLTHVTLLDLTELPRHLIIVGGGYVGVEYAQAFRRFGSEVTLIQSNARLLPREDRDFADAIAKLLKAEGVRVLLNAKIASVESRGDQILARVEGHGGISGSHLLVATGVQPNSDRLGLERAGIEVDERGYIKVDDYLETTAPGVYALGDINGQGAFTHTAYNDYQIVAANLDGAGRKVSDRVPTYGVFTDPPLGRVGMTETEARQSGHRVLKATLNMTSVGRAREYGQTTGFMKALIDADTGQILGAAVLGLSGDEVIQTFTTAMIAKAPYTLLRDAMFIHPTVSELLPTLLEKLEPL